MENTSNQLKVWGHTTHVIDIKPSWWIHAHFSVDILPLNLQRTAKNSSSALTTLAGDATVSLFMDNSRFQTGGLTWHEGKQTRQKKMLSRHLYTMLSFSTATPSLCLSVRPSVCLSLSFPHDHPCHFPFLSSQWPHHGYFQTSTVLFARFASCIQWRPISTKNSISFCTPPPQKKTVPHIEVGFKWMITLLATPNKMALAFANLCAGLVDLFPHQIRRGFFSSDDLDWSSRSCFRTRRLLSSIQGYKLRRIDGIFVDLSCREHRHSKSSLAVKALVRLLVKLWTKKYQTSFLSYPLSEKFGYPQRGSLHHKWQKHMWKKQLHEEQW